MNSSVLGLRVASVVFGLVCVGQLARLLLQLEVTIAGRHVPVWWSGIAVVVTAMLCLWLWRLTLPRPSVNDPQPRAPHEPTPAM